MKTLTPILVALTLGLNVPLLFGGPSADFLFQPMAVRQGEWWRLITHPFVHISAYHFILDAGAFFILWTSRPHPHNWSRDLFLFCTCAAGSVIAATWSGIPSGGFGGLSGIAHGLMVYQGVTVLMMKHEPRSHRIAAAILVCIVMGKACIETITGTVFLNSLHAGNIGSPITACHLGGAVAGALVALARGQPLKYKSTLA